MYPLNFLADRVVYSRPLDMIVATEARSNTLRFIDAKTGLIDSIELAYGSDALVATPDGLTVIADHGRSVSIVSLEKKELTRLLEVRVYGSLAASNEWLYILPRADPRRSPHSAIWSINYRTDQSIKGPDYSFGQLRVHPSGKWIHHYSREDGTVRRAETASGPIGAGAVRLPPSVDEFCFPYWFSEPGDLMFTACGKIYSSSENPQSDLLPAGSIPGVDRAQRIRSLSHSARAGRLVAAIAEDKAPIDSLTTYSYPDLEVISQDVVPSIETAPPGARPFITRVYTSEDGRRTIAVLWTRKGDTGEIGLPVGLFVTALR